MSDRLAALIRFWYEFVVGDDWRVATAVIIALAVTFGISTTAIPAWPVLPAFVAVALPWSLWRASRRSNRPPRT